MPRAVVCNGRTAGRQYVLRPLRTGKPRPTFAPMARAVIASTEPTLGGSTLKHEGRRQTEHKSAHAGSRLKLMDVPGRSRLIRQPSSRNGENPPCGMIGGTMETAASGEVRNAPSSYPTKRAVAWLSGFEVGPTLRHATTGAKCQQRTALRETRSCHSSGMVSGLNGPASSPLITSSSQLRTYRT